MYVCMLYILHKWRAQPGAMDNLTCLIEDKCGLRPKSQQQRRKALSDMNKLLLALLLLLWTSWGCWLSERLPRILSGMKGGGLKSPGRQTSLNYIVWNAQMLQMIEIINRTLIFIIHSISNEYFCEYKPFSFACARSGNSSLISGTCIKGGDVNIWWTFEWNVEANCKQERKARNQLPCSRVKAWLRYYAAQSPSPQHLERRSGTPSTG